MLKIRKTEKDSRVRNRILLNVLVKRDGMSVTGAARLLGMPSHGCQVAQPVPEGGHCRDMIRN